MQSTRRGCPFRLKTCTQNSIRRMPGSYERTNERSTYIAVNKNRIITSAMFLFHKLLGCSLTSSLNYKFCFYRWIINPYRTCVLSQNGNVFVESKEIFLLVEIASASWEFERRNLIRQTWASEKHLFNKEIRYLFFLGMLHVQFVQSMTC